MDQIVFQEITLENFKSFRRRQTFAFPDQPGFFFLKGINNCHSDLGSNGSGKSSLWDALLWVLYGQSVRGQRAGSLRHRFMEDRSGYSVELKMRIGGNSLALSRGWNPNSLKMRKENGEWEETTNERIQEQIRLSPNQFLMSVLFGQKKPFFLELSATEKAALFDDILDLDIWNDLSDYCGNQEKELEKTKLVLETNRDWLKKELEDVPSDESFDEKINAWEVERLRQIQEKKDGLGQKKLDFYSYMEKENKIRDRIEKEFSDKESPLVVPEQFPAEKTETNLDFEIWNLQTQMKQKEKDLAFYRNQKSCSECGQDISPDFHKNRLDQLESEQKKMIDLLKIANTEKAKLSQEKEVWRKNYEIQFKTYQERIKKKTETQEIRMGLERELGALAQKQKEAKEAGQRLKQEMTVLEQKKNPEIGIREEARQEREHLKKQIEKEEKDIFLVQQKLQTRTYWKAHFRKIRVFLSGSLFSQITQEIRMALDQVGLSGWEVAFSAEETLKSGSKKTMISVTVQDRPGSEKIPWESWSGGESQRLCLAVATGLSSFIQRLSGVSVFLEVWDEPTMGLSEEGVSQLVNFLSNRSQQIEKQVWLVDHTTPESNLFTGICCVEKDSSGCSTFRPVRVELD